MSLDTKLQTELKEVCADVFADFAPIGTAPPYITWQRIGGREARYVEGEAFDKENAFVQIEVWSRTRAEADTLMSAVEEQLCTSTVLQAIEQAGRRALAEDGLRGYAKDFDTWG